MFTHNCVWLAYICIRYKLINYFAFLYQKKSDKETELLDMIMKKTNVVYDALCEALHETKQTYIVRNFLVGKSK